MKIQYLSDIHLEYEDYEVVKTDADLLVIAGDICNQDINVQEQFHKFLKSLSSWNKPILIVMGNHEFYFGDFVKDRQKLLELKYPNIHYLDNQSMIINGVKFIGSTLWSDIKISELAQISQLSNDYHSIMNGQEKLSVINTIEEYQKNRDYLETELHQPFDGPVVVITHHLPSYKSIDRKYLKSQINSMFASSLDDLIIETKPNLWIHGHTHSSCDYLLGQTRIVCNPKGYMDENYNFLDIPIVEV
jgi:Icc-related predicted phosphoesterase